MNVLIFQLIGIRIIGKLFVPVATSLMVLLCREF